MPYVNCLENGDMVLYYLTSEETGGKAAVELRAAAGTLIQAPEALPEEGQGWSPSGFYSDGKDLYVVREDRWYQSGWLPLYRLCRIHTQVGDAFGTMEEAASWQLENTSIITGQTTGSGLLVCQLADDGQICWFASWPTTGRFSANCFGMEKRVPSARRSPGRYSGQPSIPAAWNRSLPSVCTIV